MILVDTSVWIDFFRNARSVEAEWLDENLGVESFLVGDLILAEVLQGFREERAFNEARRTLQSLQVVPLGGEAIAIDAARHYRKLRSLGVTVRGTLDVIIATRCIADGWRLLHNDRDYLPFEKHLRLKTVDCQS